MHVSAGRCAAPCAQSNARDRLCYARGMLLYNGIVRGERFIATISMSPFHGYRFVRGQRRASPVPRCIFYGDERRRCIVYRWCRCFGDRWSNLSLSSPSLRCFRFSAERIYVCIYVSMKMSAEYNRKIIFPLPFFFFLFHRFFNTFIVLSTFCNLQWVNTTF